MTGRRGRERRLLGGCWSQLLLEMFLTLFLHFSFILKGEDKEAESLVHIGEKTTLHTQLNKLVCGAAPRVQRERSFIHRCDS